MSDPQSAADTPLSPEAQAVMARARRSFAISMGILLLGFMAIGIALVYRLTRDPPSAVPVFAEQVAVPAGAEVVSALVVSGEIQVTYVLGGETVLAVFDGGTGEAVRRVVIGE
jgi:hypothetical protein